MDKSWGFCCKVIERFMKQLFFPASDHRRQRWWTTWNYSYRYSAYSPSFNFLVHVRSQQSRARWLLTQSRKTTNLPRLWIIIAKKQRGFNFSAASTRELTYFLTSVTSNKFRERGHPESQFDHIIRIPGHDVRQEMVKYGRINECLSQCSHRL